MSSLTLHPNLVKVVDRPTWNPYGATKGQGPACTKKSYGFLKKFKFYELDFG